MLYYRFLHLLQLVALTTCAPMPAALVAISDCWVRPATEHEQREAFASFVTDFYIKKNIVKAIKDNVADSYIQHNPYVADGPAATISYLSPLLPNLNFTILRSTFENGLGLVHYKVLGFGPSPTAIVDMYRFSGLCIVEHWDVIESLPANASNPHALF